MKQNVSGQHIACQMNSRTDGSPLTSSVSVFVTGDNGTRTAGGGTLAHKSDGQWDYAPTQAETNYSHIAFQFIHATGVNTTLNVYTTFPQTGDNFARLGAPTLASIAADIQSRSSHTAADIWAVGTRTLTSFGTLVADIWNNATRTLSAFGFNVTVDTNNDKTGYSLNLAQAVTAGQTADTVGRALERADDNLDAAVSTRSSHSAADVWAVTTRTLSTLGTLVDEIWAATTRTLTAFGFSVTVGTNNDKTGYTVSTVSDKTGYSLADDALTELKGTTGFFNRIADHVMRRPLASARASSYGDAVSFRSAMGAWAKMVNKWSISGTTLTVTQEDDTTSFGTQTLTSSASAEAITGVDTN
jgi:hypothetical protein